jgi:hypothetical protein
MADPTKPPDGQLARKARAAAREQASLFLVPGDTAEDAQAVLAREIATEIPEQYQREFLAMMVGAVCELVAQMFLDLVPEDRIAEVQARIWEQHTRRDP